MPMSASTLLNRNVTISGRRTSMKLEPDMWDALEEICRREDRTVHDVCTMISERHMGNNLTAAIRGFILNYFRAAATDDGHARAGHGRTPISVTLAARMRHDRQPMALGAR